MKITPLALFAALVASVMAGDKTLPQQRLKSESFDTVPEWEGHNNRLMPAVLPSVRQDFGYNQTSFASTIKGELGGKVV